MAKRVGTWWIQDGLVERKQESESFGEVLSILSSFDWTQNHGDSAFKRRDFVETAGYNEKVDQVDLLYVSTHGANQGQEFLTWDGRVYDSDSIDWGKGDLEYFATHSCKLLRHTSSNQVWRWIPAFKRLHYMLGFHTNSYSGTNQKNRGGKFALYAAWHLFFPPGSAFHNSYSLKKAWKKACIETESSSVKWAYLRTSGKSWGGTWVNTYNERLEAGEPLDPTTDRTFYYLNGSC